MSEASRYGENIRFAEVKPTTYADWAQSDAYHNERLIKPDPHLDTINSEAKEKGLPPISVSTAQGKFLNLLVKTIQGKKVVEVGTLAGFSTIWMAKGLPEGGKIYTFEVDQKHADVARENVARAGLESKVEIIVGSAVETLPDLKGDGTFDLAFIDADKINNLNYFKHAKRLCRPGGIIIVDNVVRNGRVAKPELDDEGLTGVRDLLEYLRTDTEVDATTIATVGEKAYDGFLYAIKL